MNSAGATKANPRRELLTGNGAAAWAARLARADYVPAPSGKYRYGDTRHILSDVSKLKALGWRPQRTMHDSVRAYRDWMESSAPAEEILEQSNMQAVSGKSLQIGLQEVKHESAGDVGSVPIVAG